VDESRAAKDQSEPGRPSNAHDAQDGAIDSVRHPVAQIAMTGRVGLSSSGVPGAQQRQRIA